ncbi:MAG: PhoH family protein [Bacilli bacterium]|nr:PhoH family protein [Bacilli bacterium]
MQETYHVVYHLKNPLNEVKLLGPSNSIISFLEELMGCPIFLHQATVQIKDKDLDQTKALVELFEVLEDLLNRGITLSTRDLVTIVKNVKEGLKDAIVDLYIEKDVLLTLHSGKPIYPKSLHQKAYIAALNHHEIVFAVGPAGTGKTYLAVLYAVSLLRRGDIKRIILVRPVVEAGEKLGFLPGDLKEKIDPYLVPLYDALYDCFGKETTNKMIEKGIIEVAPLAYMRGRTLDNAAIILDEAQNTTCVQMKMFLTRLGFGSKMIITGDITQIDLPLKTASGLIDALEIVKGIKGIHISEFDATDVMRHPLVYRIVKRYEEQSHED